MAISLARGGGWRAQGAGDLWDTAATAPDSRLLGRNVSVFMCAGAFGFNLGSGIHLVSVGGVGAAAGVSRGSPWRVILTEYALFALAGLQSISMTTEKTMAGEIRSAMEGDSRRTNQVGAP